MRDDATIAREDPGTRDVRALLQAHLDYARRHTRPDEIYALDVDALREPSLALFGLRAEGRLLAVGALKQLDAEHGEIKSMHTARDVRGQGIGRTMVDHLVALARERGYARVSLETGAQPAFAPARRLYARAGFQPCGPFADYPDSPNSAFMTLRLP